MATAAVVPTLLVRVPVSVTLSIQFSVLAGQVGAQSLAGAANGLVVVPQLAPLEINFKYWVPRQAGIELRFPDYRFGRGLKTITVPWADIAGVISRDYLPITT